MSSLLLLPAASTPREWLTILPFASSPDRIPSWSLPYLYIGIIGAGFLFTFFDIFDINVSFIQTCIQIDRPRLQP